MQALVSRAPASCFVVAAALVGCTAVEEDNSTSVGALAPGSHSDAYVAGDSFSVDSGRLGPLHLDGRNLLPDGASTLYTESSDPYEKSGEKLRVSSVFVFHDGALESLGPLLRLQTVTRSHVSYCEPIVMPPAGA